MFLLYLSEFFCCCPTAKLVFVVSNRPRSADTILELNVGNVKGYSPAVVWAGGAFSFKGAFSRDTWTLSEIVTNILNCGISDFRF